MKNRDTSERPNDWSINPNEKKVEWRAPKLDVLVVEPENHPGNNIDDIENGPLKS